MSSRRETFDLYSSFPGDSEHSTCTCGMAELPMFSLTHPSIPTTSGLVKASFPWAYGPSEQTAIFSLAGGHSAQADRRWPVPVQSEAPPPQWCVNSRSQSINTRVWLYSSKTQFTKTGVGGQIWSMDQSLLTSEVDYEVFSYQNFSYPC